MSFYPFVLHEISVLVELILGHLRSASPPLKIIGDFATSAARTVRGVKLRQPCHLTMFPRQVGGMLHRTVVHGSGKLTIARFAMEGSLDPCWTIP